MHFVDACVMYLDMLRNSVSYNHLLQGLMIVSRGTHGILGKIWKSGGICYLKSCLSLQQLSIRNGNASSTAGSSTSMIPTGGACASQGSGLGSPCATVKGCLILWCTFAEASTTNGSGMWLHNIGRNKKEPSSARNSCKLVHGGAPESPRLVVGGESSKDCVASTMLVVALAAAVEGCWIWPEQIESDVFESDNADRLMQLAKEQLGV